MQLKELQISIIIKLRTKRQSKARKFRRNYGTLYLFIGDGKREISNILGENLIHD